MFHRSGKLSRATARALAAWIVLLTSSVQFLHVHPHTINCGDTASPQCQTVVEPAAQDDASNEDIPGPCSICMFLAKYVADGPADALELAPLRHSHGSAVPPFPSLSTSRDWPSTGPRAPPC